MATSMTMLPSGARVTPGRWISMGWAVVREDLGNFVLITLIALALWLVAGFTVIGHFLVGGPLLTGLFLATRRRMLEGRMEVADLFQGFSRFMDSFLVCLLTTLFEFAGMLLCLFPLFLVAALYLFPYLFLADRRMSFWDSMEASRRAASQDLLGYTIFVLLLALLNLVGLMLAAVGLLVTIPVSIAAITIAYKEAVGFQSVPAVSRGPIIIP